MNAYSWVGLYDSIAVKKKEGPDAIPAIYFGTFIVVIRTLEVLFSFAFVLVFFALFSKTYDNETDDRDNRGRAHTIIVYVDVAPQSMLPFYVVVCLERFFDE